MLITSNAFVSSMSVLRDIVTSRCKARDVTDDDDGDDDEPRDILLDEDNKDADFDDDCQNDCDDDEIPTHDLFNAATLSLTTPLDGDESDDDDDEDDGASFREFDDVDDTDDDNDVQSDDCVEDDDEAGEGFTYVEVVGTDKDRSSSSSSDDMHKEGISASAGDDNIDDGDCNDDDDGNGLMSDKFSKNFVTTSSSSMSAWEVSSLQTRVESMYDGDSGGSL
jgi:hypothetical protein